MTCRVARREEVAGALRLALATGPAKASDGQVLDFMRYALARGIDTTQTYVGERGGEIVSVILPVPSAGRTLLLLSSPVFSTQNQRSDSTILIEHVLDAYAGRGTHLAQVLLDPSEHQAIEVYEGAGFERLAELLYLQASVKRSTKRPVLGEGWGWVTYSEEGHGLFARTIAATYEGSMDCPRLAGRRDIEDIVAGHRGTGEFDPSLWFVLEERGEAMGVVLLAPAPPTDSMELVYLGLTPAARGRDLGDVLVRQALWATHERGIGRLTLAVDSTNVPALKLYYRHGMRRVHAKVAMMRELGGKGEGGRMKDEAGRGEGVGASASLPRER
jgi:ribosomal protein S18 acetylase RimI-like enzyme